MTFTHPFMANSVSTIKQEMLDAIGARTVEELFEQIPADHRLVKPIDLPPALRSEAGSNPGLRHFLSR